MIVQSDVLGIQSFSFGRVKLWTPLNQSIEMLQNRLQTGSHHKIHLSALRNIYSFSEIFFGENTSQIRILPSSDSNIFF